MLIATTTETPEDFTVRVDGLLEQNGTHVYFDTSFLMWLTMIGDDARSQFVKWAATLGERTHIPAWSMHEYYRHHASGTLRAAITTRADQIVDASKSFQAEMRKYADQRLLIGQPEAAYQDALSNAITSLQELTAAAKRWDYHHCATEVIAWMNSRACTTRTVFQSMASLQARGAARYSQDMPPGFLDRGKEDTPTRGSNRYGDLLFWQEVVRHAQAEHASSVIVVTRDRKEDWFGSAAAPEVELEWKRVRTRWLPVPRPHPTLAFELRMEANADLVLLDELYLGAVLWKFGRPQFERLASAAIAVPPGHFEQVDPPPRPVVGRAQKRQEQATIGLQEAVELTNATMGPPTERVRGILGGLDQDEPALDDWLDKLGTGSLEPLTRAEVASLSRLLHDKAKSGLAPAVTAVGKLMDLLDQMPADTAAASYLGLLWSAYFQDGRPLSRLEGPFPEDLLQWQHDTAMQKVLSAFGLRMRQAQSAAPYVPDGKTSKLALRIEHDAEQQQDPVALAQVYFGATALLVDGDGRPENQIRPLVGGAKATVQNIANALSRHFGLPLHLLDIEGGGPHELRFVPEFLGPRSFSRFDPAEHRDLSALDVADAELDREEEIDEEDDAGIVDEEE